MDNYIYYIILIILFNAIIYRIYFLNFNFYIKEKKNLKKKYKKVRDSYIVDQPKLISELLNLTNELQNQLLILKN